MRARSRLIDRTIQEIRRRIRRPDPLASRAWRERRISGAAIAVEDAVAHLGVTVREVPVTPAYLHALLAEARAAAR